MRILFSLIVICACDALSAEDGDSEKQLVAARVNQVEILVDDVERELTRSARSRRIAESVRPALLAASLQKLVDRELVQVYLESTDGKAKPAEVTLALQRLRERLEQRGVDDSEYLENLRLRDEEHLRRELCWQLSWNRFLSRYITDGNLQKHFERNRPHFDGTRIRAAHILFKAKDGGDLNEARKKALKVRDDILAKRITFTDAAREHSQAPTARKGGDIGFLDRRETMPESFSRVAFNLKSGEVSEPVTTRFGVHLIEVREIQPGQKNWEAARELLEQDVQGWLFQWAAEKGGDMAKVEYTGRSPYRDANGGLTGVASSKDEQH